MNKLSKTEKRIIQIFLILIGVVSITAYIKTRNAFALFNEDEAMRYEEYAAQHTIEDSTLFIGTYLIQLSAINDELYAKAETSASDSNQLNMYYKSELSG